MKTMFKKTLLAVALAGVGASANAAVVVQGAGATEVDYSRQAVLAKAANDAVTAQFDITLNAEYKNDDVVTIKFTSPTRTGWTAPPSLVATPGAGGAIVTLGLLAQTSDTLTYRVTDVNKSGGSSTIGNIVTFDAVPGSKLVEFTAATLLSVKDIKATFSAKTATGNFDIDSATTNTAKILAAVDQFKTVVDTDMGGLIQLPARAVLASQTDLTTTFTNSGALREAATIGAGSVEYVLEGDFSWIKDRNAAAGLQVDPTVITGLSAGCAVSATDNTATKLVFVCDNTHTGLDFAFDIAANTAAAGVPAAGATAATVAQTLKATKFALTSTVSYTLPTGEATTLSAVNVGEWKVDGVFVDVPYLLSGVVGTKDFSYVVNVTNNHSQTGNVTLDVYKEDGTPVATRVAAGSVAPNAIKRLGTDIKAILGNDFAGRFSVKVFVEVPAGKAQVYSAYTDNETSERAIVINSTN